MQHESNNVKDETRFSKIKTKLNHVLGGRGVKLKMLRIKKKKEAK